MSLSDLWVAGMAGDPRDLPGYIRPYQPITPEQREKITRAKMGTKLTTKEIAEKVGVTPHQVERTIREPKTKFKLKLFRHKLAYKHLGNAHLSAKIAAKGLGQLAKDMSETILPDGTVVPAKKLEPKEIRDLGWFSLASGKAASELLGDEVKDQALEDDLELAALAKVVLKRKIESQPPVDVTVHPPAEPLEEETNG